MLGEKDFFDRISGSCEKSIRSDCDGGSDMSYGSVRKGPLENLGIASKWSHRHTAYAAGLGTFGLNDGFISERGIAIRISSIIVEADMDVTPRGDRGPYDWCLYFQNGRCGACIKRCPVDAISKDGHDKQRCLDYEDESVAKYWPPHIDKKNYIFGCGICQSKVPCRDRRP